MKKTSISICKHIIDKGYILLILLAVFVISPLAKAQDTTYATNKDAIYNRPFVLKGEYGQASTSTGGYLEANTNYFATDGISEGFSMEMRRFNIFLYATINERIKFLSELEFEHGTEEIALETALLDFEINPLLTFRVGVLLPPVGYFNQNHDAPKWDFVERPLVSTTLIPSTLSEIGFGFHGKGFGHQWAYTYEIYLVNGLGEGIIANELNRTALQKGKNDNLLEKDPNGIPSVTGRVSVKNRNIGEIGVSAYTGIYNTFINEGLKTARKRWLKLFAFDYQINPGQFKLIGEAAYVTAQIPENLKPQFGSEQFGFHTDLIYPILKKPVLRWSNTTLNGIFRFEYIDYNLNQFKRIKGKVYDELTAIVPGLSLRFSPDILIRLNYRYHWRRDLLGNPPVRTAGFQIGVASYF